MRASCRDLCRRFRASVPCSAWPSAPSRRSRSPTGTARSASGRPAACTAATGCPGSRAPMAEISRRSPDWTGRFTCTARRMSLSALLSSRTGWNLSRSRGPQRRRRPGSLATPPILSARTVTSPWPNRSSELPNSRASFPGSTSWRERKPRPGYARRDEADFKDARRPTQTRPSARRSPARRAPGQRRARAGRP